MYRNIALELSLAPQLAHTLPDTLREATCVHLRRTDKVHPGAVSEMETTPEEFDKIRADRYDDRSGRGCKIACKNRVLPRSLRFSEKLIQAGEKWFFVVSDEVEARLLFEEDLRRLGAGALGGSTLNILRCVVVVVVE